MTAKVVVFSCNWDAWSCVDAAANAGLTYPAFVSIVRLTCLSSIDSGVILRSFEYGADGVVLVGCQQHECEHGQYSSGIDDQCARTRELLQLLGLNGNRIAVLKLAPFDGNGFVQQLQGFIRTLESRQPIKTAGNIAE